jgi:N12 class adenine-specific DNA methylase
MSDTRFFFQIKPVGSDWVGSLMASDPDVLGLNHENLVNAGFEKQPNGRYTISLQETSYGVVDVPEMAKAILTGTYLADDHALSPWVTAPKEMGVTFIANSKNGSNPTTVIAKTTNLNSVDMLKYAGFKVTSQGTIYLAHPDQRAFSSHAEMLEHLYNAARISASVSGINPKQVMTTLKPLTIVLGRAPDNLEPVFIAQSLLPQNAADIVSNVSAVPSNEVNPPAATPDTLENPPPVNNDYYDDLGALGKNILGEDVLDGSPRQVLSKEGFISMESGRGEDAQLNRIRFIHLDSACANEQTVGVILSAIAGQLDEFEAGAVTPNQIRSHISNLIGGSEDFITSHVMDRAINLASQVLNNVVARDLLLPVEPYKSDTETEAWESLRQFNLAADSAVRATINNLLGIDLGVPSTVKVAEVVDEVGTGQTYEAVTEAIDKPSTTTADAYEQSLNVFNRVKSIIQSRNNEEIESSKLSGQAPNLLNEHELLLKLLGEDVSITGSLDGIPAIYEYVGRMADKGVYPFDEGIQAQLVRGLVGLEEKIVVNGLDQPLQSFPEEVEEDYSVLYDTVNTELELEEGLENESMVRNDEETLAGLPTNESGAVTGQVEDERLTTGRRDTEGSGADNSGDGQPEGREQADGIGGLGTPVSQIHATSNGGSEYGSAGEIRGPDFSLGLVRFHIEVDRIDQQKEILLLNQDRNNLSQVATVEFKGTGFKGTKGTSLYLDKVTGELAPFKYIQEQGSSLFLGYNSLAEPLYTNSDNQRFITGPDRAYLVDGARSVLSMPLVPGDILNISLGANESNLNALWSNLKSQYNSSVIKAFEAIGTSFGNEPMEPLALAETYLSLSNNDFVQALNADQGRAVLSVQSHNYDHSIQGSNESGLSFEDMVRWATEIHPQILSEWVASMQPKLAVEEVLIDEVQNTAEETVELPLVEDEVLVESLTNNEEPDSISTVVMQLAGDFTENSSDKHDLANAISQSLRRINTGDFDAPLLVQTIDPGTRDKIIYNVLSKTEVMSSQVFSPTLLLNDTPYVSEVDTSAIGLQRLFPDSVLITPIHRASHLNSFSDNGEKPLLALASKYSVGQVELSGMDTTVPLSINIMPVKDVVVSLVDSNGMALMGKNTGTGEFIFSGANGVRAAYQSNGGIKNEPYISLAGDILFPLGRSGDFSYDSMPEFKNVILNPEADSTLSDIVSREDLAYNNRSKVLFQELFGEGIFSSDVVASEVSIDAPDVKPESTATAGNFLGLLERTAELPRLSMPSSTWGDALASADANKLLGVTRSELVAISLGDDPRGVALDKAATLAMIERIKTLLIEKPEVPKPLAETKEELPEIDQQKPLLVTDAIENQDTAFIKLDKGLPDVLNKLLAQLDITQGFAASNRLPNGKAGYLLKTCVLKESLPLSNTLFEISDKGAIRKVTLEVDLNTDNQYRFIFDLAEDSYSTVEAGLTSPDKITSIKKLSVAAKDEVSISRMLMDLTSDIGEYVYQGELGVYAAGGLYVVANDYTLAERLEYSEPKASILTTWVTDNRIARDITEELALALTTAKIGSSISLLDGSVGTLTALPGLNAVEVDVDGQRKVVGYDDLFGDHHNQSVVDSTVFKDQTADFWKQRLPVTSLSWGTTWSSTIFNKASQFFDVNGMLIDRVTVGSDLARYSESLYDCRDEVINRWVSILEFSTLDNESPSKKLLDAIASKDNKEINQVIGNQTQLYLFTALMQSKDYEQLPFHTLSDFIRSGIVAEVIAFRKAEPVVESKLYPHPEIDGYVIVKESLGTVTFNGLTIQDEFPVESFADKKSFSLSDVDLHSDYLISASNLNNIISSEDLMEVMKTESPVESLSKKILEGQAEGDKEKVLGSDVRVDETTSGLSKEGWVPLRENTNTPLYKEGAVAHIETESPSPAVKITSEDLPTQTVISTGAGLVTNINEAINTGKSEDFVLDTNIAQGGTVTKFNNNIEAIRLIKKLEDTDTSQYRATVQEKSVLSEYVGWGGIPQAFVRPNGTYAEGWEDKANELADLLTDTEYKLAIASTTNAHFTSMDIIDAIYSGLERVGVNGPCRYIEPSVGTGNFIGRMPARLRDKANIVAIEKDSLTGRIANALYSASNVKVLGSTGYEDFHSPKGSFDVAIGNPPYGSYKIFDPALPQFSSSIHNFFMLKSMHLLRTGGVKAFVISRYFMDSENEDIRRSLASEADLLGAIRLPDSAFKANAGTEVVTDIVFFQKHDRIVTKDQMPNWVTSKKVEVEHQSDKSKSIKKSINNYFIENPDQVLGTAVIDDGMFQDMLTYKALEGVDLSVSLRKALLALPENVYESSLSVTQSGKSFLVPDTALVGDIDKKLINVSPGTMFNYKGKTYLRQPDMTGEFFATEANTRRGSNGRELALNRVDTDKLYSMIELREIFDELLQIENNPNFTDSDEAKIEQLRLDLNTKYDKFKKNFGFLNRKSNTRIVRQDNGFVRISALEKNYQSEIKVNDPRNRTPRKESADVSDVFHERVGGKHLGSSIEVSTPHDAMVASLSELGRVDLSYMATLLTDQSEESLLTSLENDVFKNPLTNEYEWSAVYLSGNVREKLKIAEMHADDDSQYLSNVKALMDNQPEWQEINNIGISFGAGWIDYSIYMDFFKHLAKDQDYAPKAHYEEHSGSWTFKLPSNPVLDTEWATDSVSASRLVMSAANNSAIKVYMKHSDGSSSLDAVASEKANQARAKLTDEFQSWCKEDPRRIESIENDFNYKINTDIRVDIKAPKGYYPQGLISREVFELRQHQLDYAFRSLLFEAMGAVHFAGAGKTASSIVAMMERHRIGKTNKSLLIVPNHLVGQWAVEIQRLYPTANVLLPSKTDFERSNRQTLFARAASGNWDVVVLGESQVTKLPIDYDVLMDIVEQELQELEEAMNTAIEGGESKGAPTVKRIQKQIADKETMYRKLQAETDSKIGVTLQQMGFTDITVDESQNFKNLARATKLQVTGLGDTTGSQKCTSLMTIIRSIQKTDGCVSFLSATPIANTIAEMHTYLKYMCPEKLAEKGALAFDGFINLFAQVETRLELNVTGDSYRLVDRLAKFKNVQELLDMYLSVAHTVSPDKVRQAIEEAGGKWFVPSMQGGKLNTVAIPKSPEQTRQFMEINARISRIKDGKVDPKDDNMLTALNDGRKSSLHSMMYDSDDGQVLSGKLKWAVEYLQEKISETVTAVGENGLHIVFCDLGIPKGSKDRERAIVNQLFEQLEHEDEKTREVAAAKLDTYSEDELSSILDNDKFCFQDELRVALEHAGVASAGQLASMHDCKTEEERLDLFDRCNSGAITVLFATSSKGGTGMNVSRCAAGVIDLDIPWRPDLLEQRHRRVLRQGNKFFDADPAFQVYVTCAVTEGSTDAWMLETVQAKAESMAGIIYGEVTDRELGDVGVSPNDLANAKVTATGDDLIRRQYEAAREAKDTRIKISDLRDRVYKYESKQKEFDRVLKRYPKTIKEMQEYMEIFDSYPTEDVKVLHKGKMVSRAPLTAVLANGEEYPDAMTAGKKVLVDLVRLSYEGEVDDVYIGEFNGVKVHADRSKRDFKNSITLSYTAAEYSFSKTIPDLTDFTVGDFGRKLKSTCRSVFSELSKTEWILKSYQKEYDNFKLAVKPEFDDSLYSLLSAQEEVAASLMEEVNQARLRPVNRDYVEAGKKDIIHMYEPLSHRHEEFSSEYNNVVEAFDSMLQKIDSGEDVSITDFDSANVSHSMHLRSIKKMYGLSRKDQFMASLAEKNSLLEKDELVELPSIIEHIETLVSNYAWLKDQGEDGQQLFSSLGNMTIDLREEAVDNGTLSMTQLSAKLEGVVLNVERAIDSAQIKKPDISKNESFTSTARSSSVEPEALEADMIQNTQNPSLF